MDDKGDIPSCHQTPDPDEARGYRSTGEAVALIDVVAWIKRYIGLT